MTRSATESSRPERRAFIERLANRRLERRERPRPVPVRWRRAVRRAVDNDLRRCSACALWVGSEIEVRSPRKLPPGTFWISDVGRVAAPVAFRSRLNERGAGRDRSAADRPADPGARGRSSEGARQAALTRRLGAWPVASTQPTARRNRVRGYRASGPCDWAQRSVSQGPLSASNPVNRRSWPTE